MHRQRPSDEAMNSLQELIAFMAFILLPKSASVYIYIYMPKTSSGGQILGFKMSKSRGREEKTMAKKAERRKKKQLGNMKNPPNLCFFLAIFYYKTGENEFFG